jgi:hypothetical protein
MIKSSNKAIEELNTSTRKLIEGGEKIKNREGFLLKNSPKSSEKKIA